MALRTAVDIADVANAMDAVDVAITPIDVTRSSKGYDRHGG
jgi:hypothetical protein